MTPEERAVTAAWLSEMWPTVREYHEGDPTPKRAKKRSVRSHPENVDSVGETGSEGAA